MSALKDLHIIQFDVVVAKGPSDFLLALVFRLKAYSVLFSQRTSSRSATPPRARTSAASTTASRRRGARRSGPPRGTLSSTRRRGSSSTGGRTGTRCRVRAFDFQLRDEWELVLMVCSRARSVEAARLGQAGQRCDRVCVVAMRSADILVHCI